MVLAAFALGACSLLIPLEDSTRGSGDAAVYVPVEDGRAGDASADGGTWCLSQPQFADGGHLLLCDDFDDGGLGEKWSEKNFTNARWVSLTPDDYRSAPLGLRIAVKPDGATGPINAALV